MAASLSVSGNDLSLPVDDGDAGPGDPGDLLDAGLDFLQGVQIDEPGVDISSVRSASPAWRGSVTRQKTDDPDSEHRDDQEVPKIS